MPPSKHLEPEMSNVQSGASILEVKAKPQKPGALPFFGLQNLSASPTDTASKTLTPGPLLGICPGGLAPPPAAYQGVTGTL